MNLTKIAIAAMATTLIACPGTTSSSVAPAAPHAARSTAFEEQLSRLKVAYEALVQNDPNRALALCDEDRVRAPDGILSQERDMLTIRALLAAGRPLEARARANEFVVKYPDSDYVPRARQIVGFSQ